MGGGALARTAADPPADPPADPSVDPLTAVEDTTDDVTSGIVPNGVADDDGALDELCEDPIDVDAEEAIVPPPSRKRARQGTDPKKPAKKPRKYTKRVAKPPQSPPATFSRFFDDEAVVDAADCDEEELGSQDSAECADLDDEMGSLKDFVASDGTIEDGSSSSDDADFTPTISRTHKGSAFSSDEEEESIESDSNQYVSQKFVRLLHKVGQHAESRAKKTNMQILAPISASDTFNSIYNNQFKFDHIYQVCIFVLFFRLSLSTFTVVCQIYLLMRFNPSVSLFGEQQHPTALSNGDKLLDMFLTTTNQSIGTATKSEKKQKQRLKKKQPSLKPKKQKQNLRR